MTSISQTNPEDYYKKIKEMASDKNLSGNQIVELLANRDKGEQQYKMWKARKQRNRNQNFGENKVGNRLYQEGIKQKEKLNLLQKQKEEQEIQEAEKFICSQHILTENIRSIKQFMADQNIFEQNKIQKIKEATLLKEFQSLQSHHPKINPISQKIIQKRRQNSVVEQTTSNIKFNTAEGNGLYKKKSRMEQYKSQVEKNISLSPQINAKSMKINRGFDALIQDTHRRLNKQGLIEENLKKKQKLQKIHLNNISEKMNLQRFNSDFSKECIQLGILSKEQDTEGINLNIQINREQMQELIAKLGFISPVVLQSEQDQVSEIWKLIRGDALEQGTVSLLNLKNTLKAIQNFHSQGIIQSARNLQINQTEIGAISQKGLEFTYDEIEYIAKYYIQLYSNRSHI